MILALVAALSLAQAPSGSPGPEPDTGERARFEACVSEAGSNAVRACGGVVAGACMDQPGGDTTAGMIACTSRELSLWDDLLNTAYAEMMETLDRVGGENRRSALREAQRAWIAYRDAECDQQALQFEGGSLARVIHVGCVNHLTAVRAIDLRGQGGEPDL